MTNYPNLEKLIEMGVQYLNTHKREDEPEKINPETAKLITSSEVKELITWYLDDVENEPILVIYLDGFIDDISVYIQLNEIKEFNNEFTDLGEPDEDGDRWREMQEGWSELIDLEHYFDNYTKDAYIQLA